MSEPKEIFVRLDRCLGCRSCELSCAVEHSQNKTLACALSERPTPRRRLFVQWAPPDKPVPVLCRHCADAPCMRVCATGAIVRTEQGAVVTRAAACIGCWACVIVCPFGVIGRQTKTGKAYHCDRCPDRETPACVEACPTRALVWQSVAEFSSDVRTALAKSSGANPSE